MLPSHKNIVEICTCKLVLFLTRWFENISKIINNAEKRHDRKKWPLKKWGLKTFLKYKELYVYYFCRISINDGDVDDNDNNYE